MSGVTRPADLADLAWITAPALRSHVVDTAAELREISRATPWRVRVTERGEAVVLGRWRDHLADCAILGLWCSPHRVPLLVTDLREVAAAEGFERLVGPLVPEREATTYLDAGLRVTQRVVVMRTRPRRAPADTGVALPVGVSLRDATADDLDAILSLDAACFEPFWRYDAASLSRLLDTERIVMALLEGRFVGYTLSTLRAGEGSLGRLAVAPEARRRGIGRALALEALDRAARTGARNVVLSTQEDNAASRALYCGIGFRETGDVLVACSTDTGTGSDRGQGVVA